MNHSQLSERNWLLLFHQIPPKPNYFRVKIWRRLQKLGAVGVKNSVYVLPKSDQGQEDFQWVLREVVEGGGEATLCEARLVDGLTDEQVEELFRTARSTDYQQIAEECRQIAKTLPARVNKDETRTQAEIEVDRLKRRFAEVVAIDFFGAPGQSAAQGLLTELESALRGARNGAIDAVPAELRLENPRGYTWVTRHGVHRIESSKM